MREFQRGDRVSVNTGQPHLRLGVIANGNHDGHVAVRWDEDGPSVSPTLVEAKVCRHVDEPVIARTRSKRMCPGCNREVREGMVGLEDHAQLCSEVFGSWSPERKQMQARTDAAAQMLATLDTTVERDTPKRLAKALGELTTGYQADVKAILKTFPIEGDHGIVHVKDVPFASLCEHHVLPFTGTVSLAYIPRGQIVGLSKIPRLIRAFSRRLQVQERMGKQIADALWEYVDPMGVMVIVRGRHTCMITRGVESPGEMVTSYVLGAFRADATARAEALALIG